MKKIVLPNDILLGEVERLLRSGTSVTIRTKGSSMLPFIVGGRDSVVLVPYNGCPLAGDIALARLSGNIYVLHRILSVSNLGKVTLMGDGNIHGREYCNVNDLCGKVVIIIRNGRNVNTGSRRFVFFSYFWLWLLPVRRILLAVYRRLHIINHNQVDEKNI